MLEVTVRPDSTSGTQRSLGHRRTWPLFTRSEYSAETGQSVYAALFMDVSAPGGQPGDCSETARLGEGSLHSVSFP